MTPLAEVQLEADTSVNVESEDESVAQNDMDVDVA